MSLSGIGQILRRTAPLVTLLAADDDASGNVVGHAKHALAEAQTVAVDGELERTLVAYAWERDGVLVGQERRIQRSGLEVRRCRVENDAAEVELVLSEITARADNLDEASRPRSCGL